MILKKKKNSLEPSNDSAIVNNDNGNKEVRGEGDVADELAKRMVFETNQQQARSPRKTVSSGADEFSANITLQGGDRLLGDQELIELHLKNFLSKPNARSKSSDSQDSDGNGSGVFSSFFQAIKNIFAPGGNNLQQDSTSEIQNKGFAPAIVDEVTFNPISPSKVEEILYYGDSAPRHQSDESVNYDSGPEGFEGKSFYESGQGSGDELRSGTILSFNKSFGDIKFLRRPDDNSVSYSVLDASQILLKMIKNFIRFIIISCHSCNEKTNESFIEQYQSLLDQIKNLNEKIGIFKDRQEDYEDLKCAFLSFKSPEGKVENIRELWDKIIQNESKDYISNDDICNKIKIYQNLCLLRNSLNFLVNNLMTEEIMTPNNCVYIEECEKNFIILARRFNDLISKNRSDNHQIMIEELTNCRSQIDNLVCEVYQDRLIEESEKDFGTIGEITEVSSFNQYENIGYNNITEKQKDMSAPPLSPSSWSTEPLRKNSYINIYRDETKAR